MVKWNLYLRNYFRTCVSLQLNSSANAAANGSTKPCDAKQEYDPGLSAAVCSRFNNRMEHFVGATFELRQPRELEYTLECKWFVDECIKFSHMHTFVLRILPIVSCAYQVFCCPNVVLRTLQIGVSHQNLIHINMKTLR